jgi:hypothetical protein
MEMEGFYYDPDAHTNKYIAIFLLVIEQNPSMTEIETKRELIRLYPKFETDNNFRFFYRTLYDTARRKYNEKYPTQKTSNKRTHKHKKKLP